MYIKLINGTPENYSVAQLRTDNPQTSFPLQTPDSLLAEWDMYPLLPTPEPVIDYITQDLTEGIPIEQNGNWIQTWVVTQASTEVIEQRKLNQIAQIKYQRAEAYRNESDPLYFKAQRGEATMQDWLDKIAEIKARYPD